MKGCLTRGCVIDHIQGTFGNSGEPISRKNWLKISTGARYIPCLGQFGPILTQMSERQNLDWNKLSKMMNLGRSVLPKNLRSGPYAVVDERCGAAEIIESKLDIFSEASGSFF